jgi:hypothetical protein
VVERSRYEPTPTPRPQGHHHQEEVWARRVMPPVCPGVGVVSIARTFSASSTGASPNGDEKRNDPVMLVMTVTSIAGAPVTSGESS